MAINFISDIIEVGHIPPTHRPPTLPGYGFVEIFHNGTISDSLADIPTPPILLPGKGEVVEIFAEARVEVWINNSTSTPELTVRNSST